MPHLHRLRVYWEDTDAGGIVYYANYLKFLERGRTEALRAAGIDQSALQSEAGLMLVVRSAAIDWLSPARLDDALVVVTAPAGIGGASVTLRQEVRLEPEAGGHAHAGGRLLLHADIKIACVDRLGKPARIPPALRDALNLIEA